MSLTRTVPAFMPLLFHSSRPPVPSSARKYNVPFTLMRLKGEELALPGRMFRTSTVRGAVPWFFHSWVLWVVSLALKKTRAARGAGEFLPPSAGGMPEDRGGRVWG